MGQQGKYFNNQTALGRYDMSLIFLGSSKRKNSQHIISVWRAFGKNVSPAKVSPLKESILRYIQTCHLWDTRVEMSPRGAIRLTPAFLKVSSLCHSSFFRLVELVEILASSICRAHVAVTLISDQCSVFLFLKSLCNSTPL